MEGKSPCGMVTVTVTGQQMPLACDISEEAMAEGAKAVGEKVRPHPLICFGIFSGAQPRRRRRLLPWTLCEEVLWRYR